MFQNCSILFVFEGSNLIRTRATPANGLWPKRYTKDDWLEI